MTVDEERHELEPLNPSTAREMYLDQRRGELADETHRTHDQRLQRFCEWCDETDVDNLNYLSGRDLHQYRIWRASDVAEVTLNNEMSTLRVFLRFCAAVDAVSESLPNKVLIAHDEETARTEMIEGDHAQATLEYLRKFEYATLPHVLFELLWHTGIRAGAARSIDVGDVHRSESYVSLRHRPAEDTPLKNGEAGERPVALSDEVAVIVGDYVDHKRTDVTDECGREPLFTTAQGRMSKSTIRRTVHTITRPCNYRGCPHGRDTDECPAAQENDRARECPSSVSPHPVRRGAITHFLRSDTPQRVVSDRMDVSKDVLDRHYDERTDKEKMEQRRGYLENI